MTDDPCDDLDDATARQLWGAVMLANVTDPTKRKHVGFLTMSVYGRPLRPVHPSSDPCDHMIERWEPVGDPRRRPNH